jgi:hypothetical protein
VGHLDSIFILGVSLVGLIDMRTYTKVLSALRPDTPRSISAEAFGAED